MLGKSAGWQNDQLSALQDFLIDYRVIKGSKQPFNILNEASGILKPVRC